MNLLRYLEAVLDGCGPPEGSGAVAAARGREAEAVERQERGLLMMAARTRNLGAVRLLHAHYTALWEGKAGRAGEGNGESRGGGRGVTLVDFPSMLRHTDAFGRTPAHVAAIFGAEAVLEQLLAIDPALAELKDVLGDTPQDIAGRNLPSRVVARQLMLPPPRRPLRLPRLKGDGGGWPRDRVDAKWFLQVLRVVFGRGGELIFYL